MESKISWYKAYGQNLISKLAAVSIPAIEFANVLRNCSTGTFDRKYHIQWDVVYNEMIVGGSLHMNY